MFNQKSEYHIWYICVGEEKKVNAANCSDQLYWSPVIQTNKIYTQNILIKYETVLDCKRINFEMAN